MCAETFVEVDTLLIQCTCSTLNRAMCAETHRDMAVTLAYHTPFLGCKPLLGHYNALIFLMEVALVTLVGRIFANGFLHELGRCLREERSHFARGNDPALLILCSFG